MRVGTRTCHWSPERSGWTARHRSWCPCGTVIRATTRGKDGRIGVHMRVAIVGGAGQIARLLLPLLLSRGDEVVPLVRRQEQADELSALGAHPRLLDLEAASPGEFEAALDGADAVVFAAGGGPDGNALRKRTVDLNGSLNAAAAAQSLGIRRFVQVSAIGVDGPISMEMGAVWASYVVAKRDADEALRDCDLDWTIVRPGRLTDVAATGLVRIGAELAPLKAGEENWTDISRADVAAVLAQVLHTPSTIGAQWDVIGGSTPIEAAVAEV